ncbi:TonB-dependent receptor [Granulicella sibirica]|uniref:Oar protein n=1 Tax=Granulicella sibirica TaxID=2479048 RepID=A0A4Q0T9Q9_9BACT|nr:TonB-dependent receptor [Granulicella sibirica]RXH58361.1 Oar protein [Granulicella sibirica]
MPTPLRIAPATPGVRPYSTLVLGVLLAAQLQRLSAQSATDGAISGRIPGSVTIIARETETGLSMSTHCSRTGYFLLAHLPPGDYTIELTSPDGPPQRRTHIPVHLGLVTPLLQTTEHSRPSAESQAEAPEAAVPDSNSQDESLPTYAGLPATQNSLHLDGGDQTQGFSSTPQGSGTPVDPELSDESGQGLSDISATSRNASARSIRNAATPFTFAHAAIREFHLTGNTYSALYGHAAGGILTTTTRSGTVRFHGSAFGAVRDSAFAATNPYAEATTYNSGAITSAAVKPHDARQQFGATASGPIVPRRIFFFGAYEGQRRGFPAISSPEDPSFYTLSATQRALLANRGVSTAKTNTALNYLDSLTGSTPRRSDGDVAFAKLDLRPAERLNGSLQYNRARWNQPAAALSTPVVSRARASIGNTGDKVDTALARILVRPTESLANDLRLQYGRELQTQTPQTPLPQEPAIAPNGLAPEVAISPQGLIFGTPANLGRAAYPDERRLQFADLVSFAHGRQHLQAGIDFAAVHTRVSALNNQEGTFQYDSGATHGRAGGLVDWITDYTFNVNAYPNGGCPSITAADHLFCFRTFTQSFGQQQVVFNTQQWAGFLQNDIRIIPRLTLHVGARYDYDRLPPAQNPNSALDALFPQASTRLFPQDRNNIAPRLGLSLQAIGFTFHAGYGLFYGRLPGATIRAALLNTDLPTSTTRIRITPSTTTACPQVQNQGFGYPCAYLASPAAALQDTTAATLFSNRFRLPMVQQASFTAERELPLGLTALATYRVNVDRQLPSTTDLNIAPSTTKTIYQLQGGPGVLGAMDGETFALPLYTARLTPTVGPVTAITSTANATYHALTVEARRASQTFSFITSLTWSRAIDDNPTQGAIPRQNNQLDPFTNRYDKGLSTLNFPFRFVATATLRPRLTTPNRTLRLALNGWALTPIFLRRSGSPYTYTLFGGTYLPGGHESLNGSGGALYLPTVGRNTLQLPTATTLDLRLARAVRLCESLILTASAEAYNLANHVNIAGVTQRAYLVGDLNSLGTPAAPITPLTYQDAPTIAAEGITSRPFGSYTDSGTSTSRSRQLQFTLRLEF